MHNGRSRRFSEQSGACTETESAGGAGEREAETALPSLPPLRALCPPLLNLAPRRPKRPNGAGAPVNTSLALQLRRLARRMRRWFCVARAGLLPRALSRSASFFGLRSLLTRAPTPFPPKPQPPQKTMHAGRGLALL